MLVTCVIASQTQRCPMLTDIGWSNGFQAMGKTGVDVLTLAALLGPTTVQMTSGYLVAVALERLTEMGLTQCRTSASKRRLTKWKE